MGWSSILGLVGSLLGNKNKQPDQGLQPVSTGTEVQPMQQPAGSPSGFGRLAGAAGQYLKTQGA